MSIWSLASLGHYGSLALGKYMEEISQAFGDPTDTARHIWKYDAIELHFADDRLWLMHGELGDAPMPQRIQSQRLGIHSDGLEWPFDRSALVEMIESRGFDFEIASQSWGEEYRFGLANVAIHDDGPLGSWSVYSGDREIRPRTPSLTRFEEAAIEWAGTAYGLSLVEAAVRALTGGLDTPALRVLAGASARFADEEASELAPEVFEQLGLDIPEKRSEEAFIALARLTAERHLDSDTSPRALAAEITSLSIDAGHPGELMDLYGLNEWYLVIEDGAIGGDTSSLDREVQLAAERLVAGEPSPGRRDGYPYMAEIPSKETLGGRLKRWLQFKS